MDLVHVVKRSENGYIGLNNGIMDQFASIFGEPDRALLLDCRSLEHRSIPLPLDDVALVVCHSGSPRKLETSAYNERRAQCEAAVAAIAATYPEVRALRDVTPAMLAAVRDRLDDVPARRAEHIVEEDERVLAAIDAFEAGDLDEVGRLFYASHASLRDLYEVSSPELDALVEIAKATPGVVGGPPDRRRASAAARSTSCAGTRSTRSARRCCATTPRGPASRRGCSRSRHPSGATAPRLTAGGISPRRPVRSCVLVVVGDDAVEAPDQAVDHRHGHHRDARSSRSRNSHAESITHRHLAARRHRRRSRVALDEAELAEEVARSERPTMALPPPSRRSAVPLTMKNRFIERLALLHERSPRARTSAGSRCRGPCRGPWR